MVNGYYGVLTGHGSEISTGIQSFADANRVARDYVAQKAGNTAEIYVAVGKTIEGHDEGDSWDVDAESDGYGNPVA